MNAISRILRQPIPSNAIVVAGLGRCGTTIVYDSIRKQGFKRQASFLSRLDTETLLEPGVVYKTHGYPPESLPGHVKLIFMFGNPFDIVISAHRRINEWGEKHHQHLGSGAFVHNDSVFYEDTMRLENLFDAWNQKRGFTFASVRYERLFDESLLRRLNEYLGFQLQLPPQRRRQSDWTSHPQKDQLRKVYSQLNEKIEAAESFKIWE